MSPSSRRPAPVFTLVCVGGFGSCSLECRQIAGGDDGGLRKGQQRAAPGGSSGDQALLPSEYIAGARRGAAAGPPVDDLNPPLTWS